MPPRAAAPSARSADTPAPQPLPGEAGTTRQLQERFQRQYMLPRLRQQPGKKKKKTSSRLSKLRSIRPRLLLGQMANATAFRLLSTEVFCWVRVLSTQVHTNLSV